MNSFDESEAFQQYRRALKSRDFAVCARLTAEGILHPDPVYRARWYLAKATLPALHPGVPGSWAEAWDSVEAALRSAPESDAVRVRALNFAAGLAITGQRLDRLPALLKLVRPDLRRLTRAFMVSGNLAALRLWQGKWRQALLWLDQAIREAEAAPRDEEAAIYMLTFSQRARVRSWLGNLDGALSDVGEARRRLAAGTASMCRGGSCSPRLPWRSANRQAPPKGARVQSSTRAVRNRS